MKLVTSPFIHQLKLGREPLNGSGCHVVDNPNARNEQVTVDSAAGDVLYPSLTSRENETVGLVELGLPTPTDLIVRRLISNTAEVTLADVHAARLVLG